MIIFNVLIVLITLVLLYLNMMSITKTIKIRDTFMYLNLVANEFVYTTIKPYKQKILMYNRIFFIIALISAPLVIIFNRLPLLLSLYLIIFLILPFILNQLLIKKYATEIEKLNIVEDKVIVSKLGLFYQKNDDSLVYKYGFYRYAINNATTKGKAIIGGAVTFIVLILLAIALLFNPNTKPALAVESIINNTEFTMKYDTKSTTIPRKELKSIAVLNEIPKISSKVDGLQLNNKIIGTFNLQGLNNVSMYVDQNAKTFVQLTTTANKTYIYSDNDEVNTKVIIDTISAQLKTNKSK